VKTSEEIEASQHFLLNKAGKLEFRTEWQCRLQFHEHTPLVY